MGKTVDKPRRAAPIMSPHSLRRQPVCTSWLVRTKARYTCVHRSGGYAQVLPPKLGPTNGNDGRIVGLARDVLLPEARKSRGERARTKDRFAFRSLLNSYEAKEIGDFSASASARFFS